MTGLISLQSKIGATPDGSFGPNTLKKARDHFQLSNEECAHFFGQCAHETGGFTRFVENLNYSAQRLVQVFPKYFHSLEEAKPYYGNPEKIASRVYASRMGNGPESTKDGFKFRGRGALMITGRNNYQEISDYLGLPEIITNPDLIATEYAFETAIFFFKKNKLWEITDDGVNDGTILELTKKINGGVNGLAERKLLTKQYYKILTDK